MNLVEGRFQDCASHRHRVIVEIEGFVERQVELVAGIIGRIGVEPSRIGR
jgi:hypothetical protein